MAVVAGLVPGTVPVERESTAKQVTYGSPSRPGAHEHTASYLMACQVASPPHGRLPGPHRGWNFLLRQACVSKQSSSTLHSI